VEDPGVTADGRQARRHRNRQSVIEALVALYRDGILLPSTDEIADRAGLSARSLFRYFEDVDDLVNAAIDYQMALARPLLKIDARPGDPTPSKVERFVERRLHLYEVLEPVARAARVAAARRPDVAATITEARAGWRNQLRKLFAPELGAMSRTRAARALAAADALCSFEAYQLLRHDQGLSQRRAEEVLVQALVELLGSDRVGLSASGGNQ
jgi:TetR/AcrR family transcriptional regulator, regulator of autoinduction and epiphytic fitness